MMVPVQMSRPAGPRFELCFRSFPASAPRIGGQNRCPAAAALNRCGCRRRAGSACPGRFVRRGEKGIFILAPMVGNKRKKDETEQATDAKETQRTLYGFRGVYVFDRLSRDLWPSLCAPDGSRKRHQSPLDCKHIIAQILCPVQCIPNAGFQLSAPFVHQSGVLSESD